MMKPKKEQNSTGFKIEKGIPIPMPDKRGRPLKYPLLDMEIGDSFLVEGGGTAAARSMSTHCAGVSRRYPDYRFSVRATKEGVRVWRVKGKKTK